MDEIHSWQARRLSKSIFLLLTLHFSLDLKQTKEEGKSEYWFLTIYEIYERMSSHAKESVSTLRMQIVPKTLEYTLFKKNHSKKSPWSEMLVFFLGYSNVQVKQICSRCKLMSSPADGEFNLYVKSVRLGEDENFECQVLPGPNAAMKVPLRAPAFVHIQGKISNGFFMDPCASTN